MFHLIRFFFIRHIKINNKIKRFRIKKKFSESFSECQRMGTALRTGKTAYGISYPRLIFFMKYKVNYAILSKYCLRELTLSVVLTILLDILMSLLP